MEESSPFVANKITYEKTCQALITKTDEAVGGPAYTETYAATNSATFGMINITTGAICVTTRSAIIESVEKLN